MKKLLKGGIAALGGIALSGLIIPAGLAQSPGAYRQQGLSLREQGRYLEAIAALQKAVELDPENLSGRVLLGWTQHKAGRQPEAANTLLNTLYLNPFDVPTLNALGIVYLVEGKLQSAIAAHTWAAMLKSDNEIAYYNLSLACERLQQYEWAIAAAQEAEKLEPDNPHPSVAAAIAYLGNGEFAKAQEAYRRAIAVDSRYHEITFLSYLGEAGFNEAQIRTSQKVLQSLR